MGDVRAVFVWLAAMLAIAGGCASEPTALSSETSAVTGAISPSSVSIPVGVQQQLRPSGTSGWTIADPSIASVSSTGLVTGLKAGTTTVSLGTSHAGVTVTKATLRKIAVSQPRRISSAGGTTQFIATGTFTDNTTYALSPPTIQWTTSNVAIAKISNTGLVTAVAPGTVVITATDVATGISGTALYTVSGQPVSKVTISPTTLSIPAGTLGQFNATATLGSGLIDKHADYSWTVSNPTVASVSETGEVTGIAVGTTTVTATELSSGKLATATLTVTSDRGVEVQVTCRGSTTTCTIAADQQLTVKAVATLITVGGRKVGLGWTPTWTSSNPAVATVVSGGMPTCTPSRLVNSGLTCTTQEPGQITGVSAGTAIITATDPISGFSGSVKVVVQPVRLVSLAIAPTLPRGATLTKIPAGIAVPFHASATYEATTAGSRPFKVDVTSKVTWSSSNTKAAIISNSPESEGEMITLAAGNVTITGKLGTKTATTKLTVVNGVLTSIAVAPQTVKLASGDQQQLAATAIYSLGRTSVRADVTDIVAWTSSSAAAEVSTGTLAAGLISAIAPGTAVITATIPESPTIHGTGWVTVTGATLLSLAITPTSSSVGRGGMQQFNAIGTFSDGSHRDLTRAVTWSSTNTFVAKISNAAGSDGLASAVGLGTTNITAFDPTNGMQAPPVTMRVTAATLVSLAITPATATIPDGFTKQYTATGTYTDGSHKDLTGLVTWTIQSGTATISNTGLAQAAGTGTSTIAATDQATGLSATASLVVTPATLVSISIAPSAASVPAGVQQALTATGHYSDGSQQDVTASVVWASQYPDIASVSNDPSNPGVVQGASVGTTSMTATDTATGTVGTATVNVTAATLVSIAVMPQGATVQSGSTQQFTAIGTYTDQSTRDLTALVTWSSSTSSATISNDAATPGLATAADSGPTTITALDAATQISGQASMTTVVPTLAVPDFTYGGGNTGNGNGGAPVAAGSLITISCANLPPDGVIYYTTDGTYPDTTSAVYAGPIPINDTTTLTAIALAPNYAQSLARIATFTRTCDSNCVQTMATLAGFNADIAVDSTAIYVTNGAASIVKIPLGAGTPTTIASGAAAFGAYAIAVDDSGIYWTNHNAGGAIMRLSLDGTVLTTIATGQSYPHALTLDATNVYWVNIGDGTVMQTSKSGGPVITLADGQSNPYRIAVDSTYVYWTNETSSGDVSRVPIGGGAIASIASGQTVPLGIAADGVNVYWTTFSGGTIDAISTEGGPITTLVSGQIFPYDMTTDGTNLYWTTKFNPGTVMKVGVGGGTPTTIAAGLSSPSNLVVDSTSVYWVNESDGAVMRAAK